jgi:hypothetical protein
MTHLIREVVGPGEYIFKVFNRSGALMYHGSSEATAMLLKTSLEDSEERYARQARETVSNRSSD